MFPVDVLLIEFTAVLSLFFIYIFIIIYNVGFCSLYFTLCFCMLILRFGYDIFSCNYTW